MIGRFLELSVHAPDVLASLAFYESLGFTQARTGEAWHHPYAVVTDGRLAIGLHQHEIPSPSLSFVLPELLAGIEQLERLGIEFESRRLGSDVFNLAEFIAPGGLVVRLLEARTFSPVSRPPGQTSRLGWFEEIALPAEDLPAAVSFWERLGFVAAEQAGDPPVRIGLTSDTLNIALLAAPGLQGLALVFHDPAMAGRIAALKEAGFAFAPRLPLPLDPAHNRLLLAPEGTPLLLLTAE
jgi:predicted lactoylglutathione lyase